MVTSISSRLEGMVVLIKVLVVASSVERLACTIFKYMYPVEAQLTHATTVEACTTVRRVCACRMNAFGSWN